MASVAVETCMLVIIKWFVNKESFTEFLFWPKEGDDHHVLIEMRALLYFITKKLTICDRIALFNDKFKSPVSVLLTCRSKELYCPCF